MTNTKHSFSRGGRLARALAASTIVIVGATACGGGGPSADKPDSVSSTAPTDAAAEALAVGLQAHADGDLDTAAASYHTVMAHDATNKFALYNLALIDESQANYGLAEEKYRSALESDAEYGPALFNLAILRTDNDPKEAVSLYKRAVVADKKDAAAWLNLGLLLRANGREGEGDRHVLQAIALNPGLVDPAESASGGDTTAP